MNKNETDIIVKYLRIDNKIHRIGMSDFGAIMYLINEDLKLVDFDNNYNLLCFLDSALYDVTKGLRDKDNYYELITTTLQLWNELESKYDVNTITYKDFMDRLKYKLETKEV